MTPEELLAKVLEVTPLAKDLLKAADKYSGCQMSGKLEIMEYYNHKIAQQIKPSRRYRIQPGDNWCACFVSVIAHQCGMTSDSFPFEVSVGEQVKIAKERGNFTRNIELAKPGDLIIYDWNGDKWPDHVGFIAFIADGNISTIEGNMRDSVRRRIVSMKNNSIFGVIQL